MGRLVTETPYSEITATLEALASLGIDRRDLGVLRRLESSSRLNTQQDLVRLIKYGHPEDPIPTESELTLRKGQNQATPRGVVIAHQRLDQPIVWKKKRFEQALVHPRLRSKEPRTVEKAADKCISDSKGHLPLTANIVDFLLGYPELVPETWEGKFVIFSGTRFKGTDGKEYYAVLPPYLSPFGTHVGLNEPYRANHYFALL